MQENRTEYKSMLSKENTGRVREGCAQAQWAICKQRPFLWASFIDGSNHWVG